MVKKRPKAPPSTPKPPPKKVIIQPMSQPRVHTSKRRNFFIYLLFLFIAFVVLAYVFGFINISKSI